MTEQASFHTEGGESRESPEIRKLLREIEAGKGVTAGKSERYGDEVYESLWEALEAYQKAYPSDPLGLGAQAAALLEEIPSAEVRRDIEKAKEGLLAKDPRDAGRHAGEAARQLGIWKEKGRISEGHAQVLIEEIEAIRTDAKALLQ